MATTPILAESLTTVRSTRETEWLNVLRCIVVTPERALLDTKADFVALPMFDGELGVLPGRAPLIGRLGYGELRYRDGHTTVRLFIDGGFAQVRNNVVTVLTPRAKKVSEIDVAKVEAELEAALSHTTNAAAQEAALKAQERARAQLRIAAKR
jgi:F-type H+-transporting ATPase subunit epsilon